MEQEREQRSQLHRERAAVEKALKEADSLDVQVEEAKKALATQKQTHQFHMESLSEDHKCLMDLVEEMKADLAADKAEMDRLAREKLHLMAELEEWKKKNRDLAEENRTSAVLSPTQLNLLKQVE